MGALNCKPRREDCFPDVSSSGPAPIHRLPHDVLCNVFGRVPPTYHLTLTLVCKSWKKVIEDPLFDKQQAEGGLRMPKFVLSQRTFDYTCSGNFCHGLICVQDKRKNYILMLADPVNKQTVALPRPRLQSKTYLGFDHVKCKFKVLGVFHSPYARSSGGGSSLFSKGRRNYPAQILVQGSATWRNIEIETTVTLPSYMGTSILVRGVSYWEPNDNDKYEILAFSFVTERFFMIPYPRILFDMMPYQIAFKRIYCTLINLRGRLGFAYMGGGGIMDIWVLQQHKSEIWEFRHRITIDHHPSMHITYAQGSLDDRKFVLLLSFDSGWPVKRMVYSCDQVLDEDKMNALNPDDYAYFEGGRILFEKVPLQCGRCHIIGNRIPLYSLWWGKGRQRGRNGWFSQGNLESWSSWKRQAYGDFVNMVESLYDSVIEVELKLLEDGH